MEFYESAINHKDFEAAVTFIGGRYVQHNPLITDGMEGLEAFLSFLKTKYPNLRGEIKRVFADGDYGDFTHTWSAYTWRARLGDHGHLQA